MIRRIFSFVIIATIVLSCGNTGKKDVSSNTEGSGNATKIEFASLVENPDNYIGKNVIVEGKVVHVCTESGKKLFIVGDNPDVILYIAAGENMPKFPLELLGSKVVVEGQITKVGGPAMAVAEIQPKNAEVSQPTEGTAKTTPAVQCETEAALAKTTLADIVMEYKSHTVK
jgi:ribosomal protein S8E